MTTPTRLISVRNDLLVAAILMGGVTLGAGNPPRANADGPVAITFEKPERDRIFQHSPLSPPPIDATNRFQRDDRAARLGQRLFFEPRLSRNGKISCATCHDPAKSFADGRTLSEGAAKGDRHTPALWNVAQHRWLFWDGRADTLWGQVVGPLESPNEMDGDRVSIARLIVQDETLREAYVPLFGKLPNTSDASRFPQTARPMPQSPQDSRHRAWQSMREDDRESVSRVLANVGKALAAYETRLISHDSPFDRFVVQLKRNEKLDAISASAQRGLKLFVGRADCRQCHVGPMFTDGEFHNIRVPPLGGGEPTDAGRFRGIELLRASPLNAVSRFSDDRDGAAAKRLEFLAKPADSWGAFKTPSLRNVARTPPYMHQGQFASLRDVLNYYSTLEGAVVMGHHPETVLKPLFLDAQEIDDLIAFLESLTDEAIEPSLLRAPDAP